MAPSEMHEEEALGISAFYMLWRGGKTNITMETQIQSQTFNLRQRELFVKLLTQAKTRAEKEIESDYSFNSRIENEVVPKLAEEYGVVDELKKVQSLIKQLDDARTALRARGFDCDSDGDLSLDRYTASKALRQALDDAQRSA